MLLPRKRPEDASSHDSRRLSEVSVFQAPRSAIILARADTKEGIRGSWDVRFSGGERNPPNGKLKMKNEKGEMDAHGGVREVGLRDLDARSGAEVA